MSKQFFYAKLRRSCCPCQKRTAENCIGKKRAFTLDELHIVLDVADPEWKSMILFGLYTGQRLADVLTLRRTNVDLVKGEIRFITRKTAKPVILPIAKPLKRYLDELPPPDALASPLHLRASEVVRRQGKSGALSRQFIELLAKVGLREKQSHRSRDVGRSSRREAGALSFHSLRRTATTLLHAAGVPEAVVQTCINPRINLKIPLFKQFHID